MKAGVISRFVVVAALAALMVFGGSTAAWAVCPASPNFTTDFTNDQDCLVLNDAAAFGGPASGLPTSGMPPTNLPGSNNAPQTAPTGLNTVLRLTPDAFSQSGSAWFNAPQPVANSFSTTFTFQLSGADSQHGVIPGDGIAFVIQNSGTTALKRDNGVDGCSLGFGQVYSETETCTSPSDGITNSLAIGFDTYTNPDLNDVSNNHVEIQTCGTSANSVDSACRKADVDLTALAHAINMADGKFHTATISFTPTPGCNNSACPGILDVILDDQDLLPPTEGNPSGGVVVDMTTLGSSGGTAFVGFTAATGGAFDNQDIISWTFAPQAQSAPVTLNTPAILSFNGGPNNNAYDYNAILTGGGTDPVTSATVTIKPILIDEEACEKLVDANPKFGKAQCFVYQNAGKDGTGNPVDSAVLFELTCPDQPGGTCGNPQAQNFFATLGSDFTFLKAENPGFQLLNSTIGPYPGWLKGVGLDPLHPCTPNPNGTTPLFQSNQITSFSVVGDPLGTTKGKSGGGGSCWVATFFTGGELPPGVKITSPKLTTYTKGSSVTASYTCSDPKTSQATGSPTGPYLTVASCTQSQAPNTSNQIQTPGCVPGNVCTGGVDTATKGLHAFTVTSKDSGGNVGASVVVYNVK